VGQVEGGAIEGGVAGLDGGQDEAEGDLRLAGPRRPYEEQAPCSGMKRTVASLAERIVRVERFYTT
jgi:hypothetical protein